MSDHSLRRIGLVCLVSLAFNVFALGVLASNYMRSTQPMPPFPAPPPGAPDGSFTPSLVPPEPVGLPPQLMQMLTPDQRHRIAQIRQQHAEQIAQVIRQRLEQQAVIVELFSQSEIDEPRLVSAFARIRALDNETAQMAQAMVVEIAQTLEPETRLRLADMLQRPMLRFGHLLVPPELIGPPPGGAVRPHRPPEPPQP